MQTLEDATVTCPDDETLLTYLEGASRADERAAITEHLDSCDDCRSLLADLARDDARRSPEGGGRYAIGEALGAGGMGVVYAAFDRELGRPVALKFLRVADAGGKRGSERLLREAQALAKLAHPNVTTIYDVGVLDGEVFLAMELVVGKTLRAWLSAEPRATNTIVRTLRQAGEGLAAAHAAGLVHRDFKPDNVIVGDDGRVRVTDFGLAKTGAGDDSEDELASAEDHARALANVTRTGALVGTPAYMAPEQKRGEAPDARSDQWSYCLTLREAITGARQDGDARTQRPKSMPRWLERIVERGLSTSPDERWPEMRALLAAIDRGPLVTPARAGTLLATIALAAFGLSGFRHRDAAEACPSAASAWDAYDEDDLRAVRSSFERTGVPGASLALGGVERELAAYRASWIASRDDACAATHVRHEQSERLLDLRAACLDDRRASARAVVRVLRDADATTVEHGLDLLASLPSVARCANVRSLEEIDALPADAAKRAKVSELEAKVDEGRALTAAGKPERAAPLLRETSQKAEELGYAPLAARALLALGLAEYDRGEPKAAREAIERAVERATSARDDATLAAGWSVLLSVDKDPGQALFRSNLAEASIARLGGDDALEADRLASVAMVEVELGKYDDATANVTRARALFERLYGPDFPRLASLDQTLGNIAFYRERWDEAERYHGRALAFRERVYGHAHAATISSLYNKVEDLLGQKRPDDAMVVLADLDATISKDERKRGWHHLKLEAVHTLRGEHEAALAEAEAAERSFLTSLGPDANEHVAALRDQGEVLLALHRPSEAVERLRRAETIAEAHAWEALLADIRWSLGQAYWEVGKERPLAIDLVKRAMVHGEHTGWEEKDLAPLKAWLEKRGVKASKE